MNDPDKKACPFCAEIIPAKAKVCPRCRQWLTLRSFRHPLVTMLVHSLPMIAIWVGCSLAVLSRLDRTINPKPYYSEFPNSLKILESRMNWVQARDGLRIYLTGILTNDSSVSWKSVEFDCRFFDAKRAMVDASTGYGGVTINPHDDAGFRVSITPVAPTNEYSSFTISVGNARNLKGWF